MADQRIDRLSPTRELAERSSRARSGLDSVRGILGAETTAEGLIEKAKDASETHTGRLVAKRALRFLMDLAKPDSRLGIALKTDDDIYAGAEAILLFGANNDRYVDLMEAEGVTAEAATGLYALREGIREYFGEGAGFEALTKSLGRLGIDPRTVHEDVDGALAALEEGGFAGTGPLPFINPNGRAVTRLVDNDPYEDVARSRELIWLLSSDFTSDPM